MKRHIKSKGPSFTPRVKPDIAGLINMMQQQLVSLEKKIDTLVSRSSPKPFEEKPYSRPIQPTDQPRNYNERKQENRFRERTLHKAICADCHKECEVPFKPSGDRPVYCKECFSKRKNGVSFKAKPENKPGEGIVKIEYINKHNYGETQKPAVKKKVKASQRKKRK